MGASLFVSDGKRDALVGAVMGLLALPVYFGLATAISRWNEVSHFPRAVFSVAGALCFLLIPGTALQGLAANALGRVQQGYVPDREVFVCLVVLNAAVFALSWLVLRSRSPRMRWVKVVGVTLWVAYFLSALASMFVV